MEFFCPIFSFLVILNVVSCYISPPYGYKEEWFENLPIDHFAYSDNRTFSMRFLYNDTFYKNETENAPIFFYCGNEVDITLVAQNTVRKVV